MARTIDSDRKHLTSVLAAAAAHRGTSFVEIYQNCPIFNDDAFEAMKDHETKAEAIIPLEHGEAIRFGDGRRQGAHPRRRTAASRPCASPMSAQALLVHNAQGPDPSQAFAISRLTDGVSTHPDRGLPSGRPTDVRRLGTRAGRHRPGSGDQAGQAARPGHHPVRGGLRRRHAADRGPVHAGVGRLRQRPVDAAQLPGRDPRAAGHAARRLVVPGPLRRPRHPHARRRARRTGRDEPGRAAGQPRRPAQGRHDHRRHPRLHLAQPHQGGLLRQPARRRLPRRVRPPPRRPDRDDRRGGQGVRAVPQGRRAGQEHVRARAALLDVRPPDRVDDLVPRAPLRAGPRRSATPTSRRSTRAGTSARPPRRSSSPTRSSRPRWRRAPTATSPATSRWPTA